MGTSTPSLLPPVPHAQQGVLERGAGVLSEAGDGDASLSGTGLNLVDVNGDGELDVHVTYYAPSGEPDSVYLNDGGARFTDSGLALDEETIASGRSEWRRGR